MSSNPWWFISESTFLADSEKALKKESHDYYVSKLEISDMCTGTFHNISPFPWFNNQNWYNDFRKHFQNRAKCETYFTSWK